MNLFEKVFGSRKESDDKFIYDDLLNIFTKLTPEDIESLKNIASGSYNTDTKEDKYIGYLNLIENVYNNGYTFGDDSPQVRRQLYQVYDEMDETVSYVSAALDIIADDATQADEDGVVIHVTSTSDKVSSLTQMMIDDLEIEEKLSKWARVVAKYGDFFIKLTNKNGEGVIKVLDTIYPSKIERYDFDGDLVAFGSSEETLTDEFYTPWDYVHFKHNGDITRNKNVKSNFVLSNEKDDYELISSYGQSILRPAIKVYAQLRFAENMILLSRLTNSIRRNIFLINVGDVSPDKSFETIQNYATLLKKNINLDLESSVYNTQKKTIPYDEDIFIPVSDPKNDVRIEQIGGDVNITEQYDLEYLLNKLFSALKIPKAYLNYEQDLNARATLVQLDIRYARSVSRLQQTLRGGLLRLAYINLAFHGINPETIDLDIQLTPVSSIDSETKRQELEAKINIVNSLWGTITSINQALNPQSNTPDIGNILGGNSKETPSDNEENKGLNLEYAAELLFTEYLNLDIEEVNKLFGREGSKEESDKPKTKIKFKKVKSSDPDVHAMYPTTEGIAKYNRLREQIQIKKDSTEN